MTNSVACVSSCLSAYLAQHPMERERLQTLLDFTAATKTFADLTRRSNFQGHVTASAIIISPFRKQILTIDHATLHRRLPPGGHVDPGDATLLESAYREIEEETGVSRSQLQLVSNGSNVPDALNWPVPIDIDSHLIPASKSKGEPQHFHHDFRFAFYYVGPDDFPRASPEQSGQVDWQEFAEALTDSTGPLLIAKLRKLPLGV